MLTKSKRRVKSGAGSSDVEEEGVGLLMRRPDKQHVEPECVGGGGYWRGETEKAARKGGEKPGRRGGRRRWT